MSIIKATVGEKESMNGSNVLKRLPHARLMTVQRFSVDPAKKRERATVDGAVARAHTCHIVCSCSYSYKSCSQHHLSTHSPTLAEVPSAYRRDQTIGPTQMWPKK